MKTVIQSLIHKISLLIGILSLVLSGSGHSYAQAQPELTITDADNPQIRYGTVTFSPDGQTLLITGGATASLWDLSTGKKLLEFLGHRQEPHVGAIYDAAFTKDSRFIVTGADPKTALMWNASTGDIVQTFTFPDANVGFPFPITAVALSPDDTQLLTSGDSVSTYLWKVTTGERIKKITGGILAGSDVSFFPDGKRVLIGFGTQIWQLEPLKLLYTFPGVRAIISRSGNVVINITNNRANSCIIQKWNTDTGELISESQEFACQGSNFRISPDENLVFAGKIKGFPEPNRLINLQTSTVLRTFNPPVEAIEDEVNDATFSPGGKKLAIAFRNVVQIWDISDLTTGIPNAAVFDN